MIVASILLAFGIQAWWDARGLQLTFELQLQSALAEVEDAQVELTRWVTLRSRSVRNTHEVGTLLAAVASETPLSVPDTLVASLLSTIVTELPTAQVDVLLTNYTRH